jgi:hypothetical protein
VFALSVLQDVVYKIDHGLPLAIFILSVLKVIHGALCPTASNVKKGPGTVRVAVCHICLPLHFLAVVDNLKRK